MERINEDFTNLYKRWKAGDVRKEDDIKCVDMGLPSGTLWCDRNVGASEPYDIGDYYAWGEIKTKEKYLLSTYKFKLGYKWIMYNDDDKLNKLVTEHDVVHQEYKGKWYMPTEDQFRELFDNSKIRIHVENEGTLFYITVKSKINGNELIFPFNGKKHGPKNSVLLWTNEKPNYDNIAKAIIVGHDIVPKYTQIERYTGLCIRGVKIK